MIPKIKEKEKAISLRRRGLSYSEILKRVPVAKSTLSLWFRSVKLSKTQKRVLTERILLAGKRGGAARKQKRILETEKIYKESRKDLEDILKNNLWLAGILLYWAEGSKQKEGHVSERVSFGNSDPRMIRLFLKWVREIAMIPEKDIFFEMYIHKTGDSEKALKWWTKVLSCRKNRIRVYFKRHNIKTKRDRNNDEYYGLMRVSVKKSSKLNRNISAWIDHLCQHWGIV